ncbi:unnamed protein product [Euphydryas editha]|uniref:Elongation of very long chain fatty acids protein n=1 Tax=Euphydryas editha TaxID=104508 RepID=A0AAU9UJU4_EUPED|nr:unnamed protein product [Euphydryas editha]
MSAEVGLQYPDWDLNKSRYEETDSLPLMATPGPIAIIITAYLLFVLKIGPSIMSKRKPYKLTTALLVYNAIQVVFSAYIVQRTFKMISLYGLIPKTCYINNENYRKEMIFVMWTYFAAKISELLDTVFFVLRKKDKQITFLHIYHHSSTLIIAWAFSKYWPSETLFFIGFINSLIHVFMYLYYGLSALGPKATKYIFWKKYMTKIQMIQLVGIIVHFIIAVQWSECPLTTGVAIFLPCNVLLNLILFLNFYWKNYNQGNKTHFVRVCNPNDKEA